VSPWLAAAYGVLALGLAWSIAGGSPWLHRVPFIVAAPPLALALWLGRPDPAGWPSSGHLPAHASLVSAYVREPDPTTSDRGRIYVWLDTGAAAPRAFSLPYSRPLHRQVVRALAHVAQRQSVEVRTTRARSRSSGPGRVSFVAAQQRGLPPKHPQPTVAAVGLTAP
jgi:hypothetical protein